LLLSCKGCKLPLPPLLPGTSCRDRGPRWLRLLYCGLRLQEGQGDCCRKCSLQQLRC
jgi:hypothetical protein